MDDLRTVQRYDQKEISILYRVLWEKTVEEVLYKCFQIQKYLRSTILKSGYLKNQKRKIHFCSISNDTGGSNQLFCEI
jgi:hypothetical protein